MDSGGIASFSALRTLASRSDSISEADILRFLRSQPELRDHEIQVRFPKDLVTAGASGGTIFFELEAPDPIARYRGEYVLRFGIGDQGIFAQISLKDQFQIMRALRARGAPVPDAVWFDEKSEIVRSAPSLIMRRVRGLSPSMVYLQAGVYVAADADTRRRMVEALIGFGARIHALPLAELGLDSLYTRGGEGDHFIDREIRWAQNELHTRFPEVEEGERAVLHTEMRSILDAAADWLRERAPRHRKPVLAHGDLTLANVIYNHDGSVAAMLDWELCHHGLAEEDIAYLIFAARSIAGLGPVKAELPPADDIIAIYRAAGGVVHDWDYAAALSTFRLATWGAIGMRRMPREFWPAQKLTWELQSGFLREAMEAYSIGGRA